MTVRAIRGATRVDVDEREHVIARTRELVAAFLEQNALDRDDVISMVFSATKDIRSIAPAAAARQLGLDDCALLCVQEMDVEGSLDRMVRFLAHAETELPRERVANVYLHGSEAVRREVPPIPVGLEP